jgi:hypothetical protein
LTTSDKIKEYFKVRNLKKKPVEMTWSDIGKEINVSAEAARCAWKRTRLSEEFSLNQPDDFPKILVFDIETAPLRGHMFRLWKQNIAPVQLLNSGNYFILCWSAKWLFQDRMLHDRLTPKEALEENDYRVVKSIHSLLDEADIVIAHWGSNFDVPMLNGRFVMNKIYPPSSFQLIDTKVHAAKAFRFPSNKLDYIAQQFGVGSKIKTDFELWGNCLKGDENALVEMERYCIEDVRILEHVYLHMRPYIKPHPNIGLYIDSDVQVCPTCSSSNLLVTGSYYTTMNKYEEMKCLDCGALCRNRKSNTLLKIKNRLTSSIPK